MVLHNDKSEDRASAMQPNNCEQPDLFALENIQKNEATTFLQPTFAPKMMRLSKFLEPFDESSLTDEEAAQKYNTYVAGFLKDQLSEQFERHKNSTWFREKFHPDHFISKEEQRASLMARFCVFKKMRDEGYFSNISLEYKERTAITKLIDHFAFRLAGGAPEDVAELDAFDPFSRIANGGDATEVRKHSSQISSAPVSQLSKNQPLTPKSGAHSLEKESAVKVQINEKKIVKGHQDSKKNKKNRHSSNSSSDSASSASSHSSSSSSSSAVSSSHSTRSRSQSSSSDSSSTSSSSSSSISSSSSKAESEITKTEENVKGERNDCQEDVKMEADAIEKMEVVEEEDETVAKLKKEEKSEELPPRPPPLHVTRVIYLPYLPLNIQRATVVTLLSEHPDFLRFACLDPTPIPSTSPSFSESLISAAATPSLLIHRPAWITFTAVPTSTSATPLDFIRNLVSRLRADSSSTPSEASHLAAALAAARPLPVPFNLDRVRASTRLATILMASTTSSCHFNPMSSKSVMRRHLVMSARLAGRLDEVWALWKPNDGYTDSSIPGSAELDLRRSSLINAAGALADLATRTGNPLLENLTDYLVDESNPDEEVLMLSTSGNAKAEKEEDEEGDAELAAALDQLLLYLRLVYSVDFYAPALYPRESDMPHPCAVLHVRPSKLSESVPALTSLRLMPSPPSPVFGKEASARSAHRVFARQISRIFRFITPLSMGTIAKLREIELKEAAAPSNSGAINSAENPEEQQLPQTREMDTNEQRLRLLGYRDAADVVEAFIKANTKRKKRKVDVIWVCPLSDKKFRGPGFVRKHILNKFSKNVEEAKKETAYYFNNFLLDPLRPELMRPPRRHLPVRRRNFVAIASSASSAEDGVEGVEGSRSRQQAFGGIGGRNNLHQMHSTSYWRSRSNAVGRSFSRGVFGGNNQRRYGRPNPRTTEQRGGGGVHKYDGNRNSRY